MFLLSHNFAVCLLCGYTSFPIGDISDIEIYDFLPSVEKPNPIKFIETSLSLTEAHIQNNSFTFCEINSTHDVFYKMISFILMYSV